MKDKKINSCIVLLYLIIMKDENFNWNKLKLKFDVFDVINGFFDE